MLYSTILYYFCFNFVPTFPMFIYINENTARGPTEELHPHQRGDSELFYIYIYHELCQGLQFYFELIISELSKCVQI